MMMLCDASLANGSKQWNKYVLAMQASNLCKQWKIMMLCDASLGNGLKQWSKYVLTMQASNLCKQWKIMMLCDASLGNGLKQWSKYVLAMQASNLCKQWWWSEKLTLANGRERWRLMMIGHHIHNLNHVCSITLDTK